MNRWIAVLLTLTLALSSCQKKASMKDQIAASVGDQTISYNDVQLRNAIIGIDYPQYKNQMAGLDQLIRADLYAAILKQYGQEVSHDRLLKEAARIDRETRTPKKLSLIKSLFGKDQEAYLRVYVKPAYVGHVLPFQFFPHSKEIHQRTLDDARAFLKKLRAKPGFFEHLTHKENLKIEDLEISSDHGMKWVSPGEALVRKKKNQPKKHNEQESWILKVDEGDQSRSQREAEKWIEQIVPKLKKNPVFSKVIDFQNRWLVIKLKNHLSHHLYLFEVVSFKKIDFSSWLKRESAKIPVKKFMK